MGEVYKARDTRLNRVVAIKKLKAEHGDRFKREARAVAALNHPHICQIYDVGPDYLVLEYVEGRPLKGPLPIDETVRLAIQIASALEEAHSRGILHRDLKPDNIMLTTAGAAKLLDFGLAKMDDPAPAGDAFSTLTVGLTKPGAVVGTLAYVPGTSAGSCCGCALRHLLVRSGSVLDGQRAPGVLGRHPVRPHDCSC